MTGNAIRDNYEVLIEKLDGFIRKYYRNELIRGGIYAAGLSLACYLAVTVLEYFAHFDTLVRTALFYGYLAGMAYVAGRFVIHPLLKLYRLGRVITHEQAAQIIGRHFPEVGDKLLNTLQLRKLAGSDPGRRALIEAGIRQKAAGLRPVPFASAIDLSENRRYVRYAAIPLVALLVILFSAPSVLEDGTRRLLEHRTYFEKLAPFRFVLENGPLETVSHEDFELRVRLEGRNVPQEIFLETNGQAHRLTRDNAVHFRHVFRNVQSSMRFRLSGNEFRSQEYELVVLPKPIILDFVVDADYPDYTGRRDERLRNIGDLAVPAGTQLSWSFQTRDTRSLTMRFGEEEADVRRAAGNRFTYSGRFLRDSRYTVATQNERIRNRDSITYVLNVIPDQYPAIEVEEFTDSLSGRQRFYSGVVQDDYGFTALSFHYHISGGEKREPFSAALTVKRNATRDQFFYEWDLGGLNLAPGEELIYYFEVWDNDAVNGRKASRSRKFSYKAPTGKELAEKAARRSEAVREAIEESIRETRQLNRELSELSRKMLEKNQVGWEEKKRMQDVIERQKELQKKVEGINRENQTKQREQDEFGPQDEMLAEKQRQLNELFEQLMTDEMKEMFRKMEELLQNITKEQVQEMLDKMKLDSKSLEKELDRTLEIFKQLEFEQKLDQAIEDLEKLAEKEEKLAGETEKKESREEDLLKEQEEIQSEFDEMKKQLDDLEKLNKELERSHGMQETDDDEQKAGEEMQKSSEQLKQGKKSKASQSQKNASQSMKNMQAKLESTQSAMQSQGMQEDMDALRALLENLVKLSFDQEDLMEQLKTTDRSSPSYVAINRTQKKLKDDAKMIEDSLFALSKRIVQLQSIVNQEISSINMNMDKAIQHLSEAHMGQNNTAQARSRQQFVMTSVNNLALMLDEVLQQMQQSQNAQGGGTCTKPGSGKEGKSISTLKQMQEQLNKQIRELMEGSKPGMSGTRGPSSEELARLAAQQEALRNHLQKINQELNKDGKKGLGDLEGLMKKMEETEKDLVNRNLTRQTLLRQQEIMTRLLESEKAERERGFEEKREAEERKTDNFSNPGEFLKYKGLKERETELLRTVPPTLNPFYKRKVNDYFSNYNKETTK